LLVSRTTLLFIQNVILVVKQCTDSSSHKYSMRISEILNELSFKGSQCTKDCSGHLAGYAWTMRNKGKKQANARSASFNKGSKIANDELKTHTITAPTVEK